MSRVLYCIICLYCSFLNYRSAMFYQSSYSAATWYSSFAHWRFVFSMICMGCYSCAFGSYFRVRSSYEKPKNLFKNLKPKNLKPNTFLKSRVFSPG